MKNKLNKNFEVVNTIQQTLHYKQLVNPDEYALLAVSGGQDSIGLLITFYFLKTQWNWVCGMVWCHHLWQKDSFYTMAQLARLGFCFQLPTYFAIHSDVSPTSSIGPLSKPRQGVAVKTNLVCFPARTTSEANAFKDLKNTTRRLSPRQRRTPLVDTEGDQATPFPRPSGGFAPPLAGRSGEHPEGDTEGDRHIGEEARRSPTVKVYGEKSKDVVKSQVFAKGDPKEKGKVKQGDRKNNKEFKNGKAVFTEKNARDWRHRLNQRICFFYNYNFCVQGHNGSDRVETVLFNLMRGSGKNGVCALQWTQSRVPFSLNKFYCSDSQQFRKSVYKLRMKTKYYYQVKSVLKVSSCLLQRTL